jgi:outer membrane protein assembly factor BamB
MLRRISGIISIYRKLPAKLGVYTTSRFSSPPRVPAMTLRRTAAGIFTAAALLATASAADWVRFRGPNGTGVVEGNIPLKFTLKDDLVWKTKIPGVGHGSPIVVKDKVFLQTSTADQTGRMLMCLDAKTGQEVWSKQVAGHKQAMHKKNSGASSTPASDGERVFLSVWDGTAVSLMAFDFTGKELWNKPINKFTGQHGAGHSPMTHDGMVYFNFDDDVSAKLVAFDAKTGDEKWSQPRKKERASYTTPFILETSGKPAQLILGTTTTVDSYNPKTGAVNWTFNVNWAGIKAPLRAIGQPVLAAGNILTYFGEGGSGRYMVSVKPDGKGDVSGKNTAWESREKDKTPYVPSMIVLKDHIYWVNDTGFAACADAKTGKIVWYERIFSSGVSASPILVGDTIFAIAEDGTAKAFKASPSGLEETGTSKLGEGVYASPAAAGGKLFIRGMEHLYCIGLKGS